MGGVKVAAKRAVQHHALLVWGKRVECGPRLGVQPL
jgi:hypothetical protein